MTNEAPKEKRWFSCAIYTRKSSAEGLDQDFTSLDAQREASENYIASQKNEGWLALPDLYDDGGFTGANTDRPALQKLLNDIKDGKINCVVVYKVDRLSRSLLDFSQLLEFFDQHNVTFVSVTQHFNTNSSMGRLTLNILLSFAQFEREIISERTRDKIGAARKRGQWHGGITPLGYKRDPASKKLVIDPDGAEIVREIFQLYLAGNSLLQVARTLNNRGLRTRVMNRKSGKKYGGNKYGLTVIQKVITNVTYIGKLGHKTQIYNGLQEAIIDEATFKKAQERLKENRVTRKATKNTDCTGLLNHLLHCPECSAAMFHTYTMKSNRRKYRYYVCTDAQKRGYSACPTKSVNAQAIKESVISQLKLILSNRKTIKDLSSKQEIEALLTPVWDTLFPDEQRRILKKLIERIDYSQDTKKLGITLAESGERTEVDIDFKEVRPLNKWHSDLEIKKVPIIRRNLILAYQIQKLFEYGQIQDFKQAATWLNLSGARISQIVSLNFLSPEIKERILLSPSEELVKISDRDILKIAAEVDLQNQLALWQSVLK